MEAYCLELESTRVSHFLTNLAVEYIQYWAYTQTTQPKVTFFFPDNRNGVTMVLLSHLHPLLLLLLVHPPQVLIASLSCRDGVAFQSKPGSPGPNWNVETS